jgi:molecular chaperone GrpE
MQGKEPRPRDLPPESETAPGGAAADAEGESVPESVPQSGDTGAPAAGGHFEAGGLVDAGEEVSLEDALSAAEQDLAKHREVMLRMQAEMENLRKRQLREVEKSRKFALERIMKDLLLVRDSMERALAVAGESSTVESLREGQQLTLKMLAKVMQDHGLEVIDPLGQPFDPAVHEAMTVMPSAEAAENTVLEVMQKGFRLHDRLLRPAMVVVSRKP